MNDPKAVLGDGTLAGLVESLSANSDAYMAFRKQYLEASDEERAHMLLEFATTEQELAMMTTPEQSIVWTTTATTTTVTTIEADY